MIPNELSARPQSPKRKDNAQRGNERKVTLGETESPRLATGLRVLQGVVEQSQARAKLQSLRRT
jgi:hypothetical protein